MKKLLALLLALTMVFALAACAGATPAADTGTEPAADGSTEPADVATEPESALTDDPVTLKIWLDNDDWANAVMEAFTAKYPNVSFDFENVGNADSHNKISLDGPAGLGADVFLYPHDQMARAINDGLAEPVPADYAADYTSKIMPAAIETVTHEGTMYGVPVQSENIALFYNKDLWGKEEAPATFEEIIEFSKTYNDPSTNKWALGWQVEDPYYGYSFLTAAGYKLFGENGDDFRQPNFDSPEAAQGVEYFLRLKEVFNVPITEANWDNTVVRFQNGELPFCISGPWAIADAVTNGVNFGTSKLPTIDGNQPVCFSGLIVASVSSYSENMEWANEFCKFLAEEEGAAVMYRVKGTSTALSDISAIEGLKDDALLQGIAQQSPFANPMPTIPEGQQMWDAMKCLFQFTWDSELSVADAQAKAMDTYRTLLATAGKSMD